MESGGRRNWNSERKPDYAFLQRKMLWNTIEKQQCKALAQPNSICYRKGQEGGQKNKGQIKAPDTGVLYTPSR